MSIEKEAGNGLDGVACSYGDVFEEERKAKGSVLKGWEMKWSTDWNGGIVGWNDEDDGGVAQVILAIWKEGERRVEMERWKGGYRWV